jgi:hypothetical protein
MRHSIVSTTIRDVPKHAEMLSLGSTSPECVSWWTPCLHRGLIRLAPVVGALSLIACTTFQEVHYFKTTAADGSPANYFRLTITGTAGFSSAKYVSGYYDETAVDLLFNELKSDTSDVTQKASPTQKNAAAGQESTIPNAKNSAKQDNEPQSAPATAPAKPSTQGQLTPLDPSKQGSFVMIFSTNADAVADTIGNFAEGNATAQAIGNLVKRSQTLASQQAAKKQTTLNSDAAATSAELSALLDKVPTNSPEARETIQAYLRVLSAISRALGAGQDFQSLEQASTWFSGARLSTLQE